MRDILIDAGTRGGRGGLTDVGLGGVTHDFSPNF
jgi:hypothetical protein